MKTEVFDKAFKIARSSSVIPPNETKLIETVSDGSLIQRLRTDNEKLELQLAEARDKILELEQIIEELRDDIHKLSIELNLSK